MKVIINGHSYDPNESVIIFSFEDDKDRKRVAKQIADMQPKGGIRLYAMFPEGMNDLANAYMDRLEKAENDRIKEGEVPAEEEKQLISYSSHDVGINVFIPNSLLVFVANHHPENIKVTDPKVLREAVVSIISERNEDPDTGLKQIEQIIDYAICEAACNDEGAEYYEPDIN